MKIAVKVESSGATERIRKIPAGMRSELMKTITGLTIEAQARVKQKLSGEVLHVRTGVLRNSIARKVWSEADSVVGAVGTKIKYGKVHEYGFKGIVTVSSHLRRTRLQMKRATYSYRNNSGSLTSKVRMTGKKGVGTGEIMVRQHTRHANYPERSFLRSTLHEMANQIRADILAAVNRSTK